MDQVGEAELLTAAAAGDVLVCGDDSARRGVDAALLRRCCRELRDRVDPRGVRLSGARIGGSLDLTGACIESPGTGLALDLGEAVIEASVFLIDAPSGRRPLIRGRIDMGQARIGGQFLVRNATLEARAGAPVGSAYSRSRAGG